MSSTVITLEEHTQRGRRHQQGSLLVNPAGSSSSSCSSVERVLETWEENHRTFQIEVQVDCLRNFFISRSQQTQEEGLLPAAPHVKPDPVSSDREHATHPTVQKAHIGPDGRQVGSNDTLTVDDINIEEPETDDLPGGNQECPDLGHFVGDKYDDGDSFTFIAYVARGISTAELLRYTRRIQRACVYGVLMREAHCARRWLRQMMAEADAHLEERRLDMFGGKSNPPRSAFGEEFLNKLKDLLGEVIEQKSVIESLIRESWAYLDHDPDTLLYFDIADIECTWQRLQHKLRRLGTRPWTSRTPLCELDHRFATRKEHQRRQQRRRRPQNERHHLSIIPQRDAFPCSLSSPYYQSSSSPDVEEALQISGIISPDFEFSSQSFASQSPLSSLSTLPESPNLDLVSPIQFKTEDKFQRTLLRGGKDQRAVSREALPKREGSSLPDLFFYSHRYTESCGPAARKHKPEERIFYRNNYSSSGSHASSLEFEKNSSGADSQSRDTGSEDISDGNHFRLADDAFELRHLAASEGNLLVTKANFPSSLANVSTMEVQAKMPAVAHNGGPRSGRSSPHSGRNSPLGVRPATPLGADEEPVLQKRRRMNHELPVGDGLSVSGGSSPRDSPASLHLMLNPGMTLPFSHGSTSTFDDTFDDLSDSQLSGQEMSPSVMTSQKRERLRGKYRKDELWAAIQSDYHYLMDGEIIETCKSTESDLSWESDDLMSQTKVSFTEFMQQYKELTEWLNHIQMMTQRQSASLSEKYLNQTYHEEMLQRSPRRKVFNDYAKQLTRRYPSMKEEITMRLQHLNGQWETLEKIISSGGARGDEQTMLRDLEQDLNGLRTWLHEVEDRLLPLCVRPHWKTAELESKLKEHQVLQRDIESHSKIVSAVLKLCEHLQSDKNACSNEVEKDSLQLVAVNLERRWHAIWLQSLEWQCRLEEAITHGNGLHNTRVNDQDWGGRRFGFSRTTTVDITNHDLSDGQSSCDEELSELIDSDHSNSDIIPFSENEYEKITVDTDCQTDAADDGQVSPGAASASSKGSACSSGMDPAIDSALGRSVSDHSINNEQHQLARQSACLKITTDQVNRAVNKVVSFAQETEMRGYDSKSRDKAKKMMKPKGDHDIGYSSESHSNDEPDFGCRPLDDDQVVPGGLDTSEVLLDAPREGSPETSIERPRSLDTIVLRRKLHNGSTGGGSSEENAADSGVTMPSPVTPDKSWRHSMTSAYETSSQCSASRSNSPFDLNATLDTTTGDTSVCTTIERGDLEAENESYSSIHDLMASSNHSFYVMTSVESDADTGSCSKHHNITTGEDPGREGDAYGQEAARAPLFQLPSAHNSPKRFMLGLEQSTPVKGQDGGILSSQVDYESLGGFRCTPIKGHELSDVDCRGAQSESLCGQLDSEASAREAALSSEELLSSLGIQNEQPAAPPTPNSISKLVQQAELMVREGDLAPPANKLRRRRKGRSSRHRVATVPVDSYTDTTSAHHTDSPVSSCDASAESESEGETSATSGADQRLRSVFGGMGQKCHTLPRAKCDQRHDRQHTCSVTQLYEMSTQLDFTPFSISEGAIDCATTARKVRHTNSMPYRKRKLLLPRSASYECGQTLSASPLGSRRDCCSMPGSRQQSSQEWPGQSVTSPDECSPSIETRLHEWPAQQGEEDRLQAVKIACKVVDGSSDNDMIHTTKPVADSDNDVTWRSVFNTTGEFSENAWDPYQDPPYHVTSDDPTEEKLDPLGFENDLEYDQYFHLDSSFGCGRARQEPPSRPREKRTSVTASYRDLAQEDSDSDLEELQHVVEESRKQIGVAETVLGNHHKDGLGTGLYLDPSPYTELVATCQTNIKCLEVLCDTIDSGEVNNSTITDDDLQVVQDVIDRWGELHSLAVERQQQSRELAGLAREMAALRTAVTDATDELDLLSGFDDVCDLELAVKELQARSMELLQRRPVVDGVLAAARQFSATHPAINMTGFAAELDDLSADLQHVIDRCTHQVSGLKSSLMAWYDFRETTKELTYLVGRDRHQLQCLAVTYDVIAVSLADAVDTVHDLRLMKAEFELYESKLWSLRTLSADILPVCDDTSAADVRHVVTSMDADVSAVSQACDDLIDALEEKVAKQGGSVLLHPETAHAALRDLTKADLSAPGMRPAEPDRPSLLWRIFRIAVPLHLTLVVLLGMAYLLDPESFSIFISPQLRYVRGPPPV